MIYVPPTITKKETCDGGKSDFWSLTTWYLVVAADFDIVVKKKEWKKEIGQKGEITKFTKAKSLVSCCCCCLTNRYFSVEKFVKSHYFTIRIGFKPILSALTIALDHFAISHSCKLSTSCVNHIKLKKLYIKLYKLQ